MKSSSPILVTVADVVPPARPGVQPAAGAIVQDEYDLETPWHTHDRHQLQYAFAGALEVEDAHGCYVLTRRHAAWIPAGLAHRTSLHRVHSGSVLFEPSMVPRAGQRVRIIEVSPLMREMVIGAMRWPFQAPRDPTADAYFQTLAMLCAEWITQEARPHLPTSPELRQAIDYTRAHLVAGDIAGAARAAAVSERTLRRRFRSLLGMTWDEYRRRARVHAADVLLSDTRMQVGEVASAVGFESQSAFARAYKSLTGRTPRQTRQR